MAPAPGLEPRTKWLTVNQGRIRERGTCSIVKQGNHFYLTIGAENKVASRMQKRKKRKSLHKYLNFYKKIRKTT